jgi:hypothetical protein
MPPPVPTAKAGGRPEPSPTRAMRHARWSLARSGGAWRWRPHDVPPWPVVEPYVRAWRAEGTWLQRPDLRRGEGRGAAGQPAAAPRGDHRESIRQEPGTRGGHGDDPPQTRPRPHTAERRRHLRGALAVGVTAVTGPARAGAIPRLDVRRGTGSRWRRRGAEPASAGTRLAWGWARRPRQHVRLDMVTRPAGIKGGRLCPTRGRGERTCGWRGRDRR